MSHHLVGSAEAAGILGVSRQRLAQLTSEAADFPEPEVVLSCGRIWTREAIEGWAVAHRERGPRTQPKLPPPGEWAPQLSKLHRLASTEARELNHNWVGTDHLLLAMLRADCPGRARTVLESFGLRLEDLRKAWVESMGDPFETAPEWTAIPPHTQLVLERANFEAIRLQDDEVTSEHVLLAMAYEWDRCWITSHLARQGISAEAVRERVMTITERQPEPADSTSELDLAPSPLGHDPRRRRPWGSAVFEVEGRACKRGHALLQYFIDRDGCPVLTTDGRPVHMKIDEEGRDVRDASGNWIVGAVEVPPGAAVRNHPRE